MITYYKLDDENKIVPCNIEEWRKFIFSPKKIVKQEYAGNKWVSTVMLNIDHNFGFMKEERPILFETMVFPCSESGVEEYCDRYCTYDEALAGHNEVVENLKQGLPLYEEA